MTKFISTIAILLVMVFMAGGLTQKADASPAVYYTSANGFQWANPFDPLLLNKDYPTQLANLAPDFTFGTLAQVEAAAFSDGYTADLAGITAWLTTEFFGGVNPTINGGPCGAPAACEIRLGDSPALGFHTILAAFGNVYGTVPLFDAYAGNDNFGLGALVYKLTPTPEPSITLLIGAGLMGLSYLAYRRRKP